MRIYIPSSAIVALLLFSNSSNISICEARSSRSNQGRGSISSSSSRTARSSSSSRGASASSRRKRAAPSDYDDERYDDDGDEYDKIGSFGILDEEEENIQDYDEYDDFDNYGDEDAYDEVRISRDRNHQRKSPDSRGRDVRGSHRTSDFRPSSQSSGRGKTRGPEPGNRRSSSSRSRSGRVVPYARQQPQPSAFTRGLAALRESIPDPTTLKDTALHSIAAAKESTSKLSSNIYRDIKGLTSSELEQVMLKATRPDDSPVKGKHVERLVGVTYQISGRYDIYDAVLRKLWSKMVEKDWRTTIKALYILHRFSADGAPDHQAALKARLRELRRTQDPKRKDKFFNSKQLLAGDSTEKNIAFRAFLGRYAHYVLLRAQCFGGVFSEIANNPSDTKSSSKSGKRAPVSKPITSTCLKNEHLEASKMLLKAGLACSLKKDEECEHTAVALERVASDLIGLTTAVATSLNVALKGLKDSDEDDSSEVDKGLLKLWCEFYANDLLPETKGMVKNTSPTLDKYGLFLPSRMGASVPQDLLQMGLRSDSGDEEKTDTTETSTKHDSVSDDDTNNNGLDKGEVKRQKEMENEEDEDKGDEDQDEGDEYDEYEYDEEEYYDEE